MWHRISKYTKALRCKDYIQRNALLQQHPDSQIARFIIDQDEYYNGVRQ